MDVRLCTGSAELDCVEAIFVDEVNRVVKTDPGLPMLAFVAKSMLLVRKVSLPLLSLVAELAGSAVDVAVVAIDVAV